MPQPYPGQDWKHGWVPVTATAARSKNHGRKPGAGSALARVAAEAGEAAKNLRSGPKQNPKADSRPERSATPKAAPKAAPKPAAQPPAPTKTPTSAKTPAKATAKAPTKPATKAPTKASDTPKATKPTPKPGAKVGSDSHGKPLRVGDEVRLTGGADTGKNGRITSRASAGQVKVDVDGREVTVHGMNVRSRADHETSRSADDAIRRAAGRPASNDRPRTDAAPQEQQPVEATQGQIRDVYNQLAEKPGDWVSLTKVRERLSSKLGRAHVDDAMRLMNRMPGVNFAPESNQKTLKPADRAAAVHFGGQDKHLLSIAR